MKIFGDAETKKKFDKGAAFIVYNTARAASFRRWLDFELHPVACV